MPYSHNTTVMPKTVCCHCGAAVNRASGPGSPSVGDFSLCVYCAGLNIFAGEMGFRLPTEQEQASAEKDATFLMVRGKIQRALRIMKKSFTH